MQRQSWRSSRAGIQLRNPSNQMPNEQSTTQNSQEVPPGWQVLPDTPLPHPTYFPAGLAMGVAFIFWGLITTWVVWLVGVVLFIAALAGWITEIRHEYKSH
jgi:hypothetical protein